MLLIQASAGLKIEDRIKIKKKKSNKQAVLPVVSFEMFSSKALKRNSILVLDFN